MNKVNFEFSISSDIDFEDLIADIGFEDKLVAILTQEQGFENLRIRIYPPKNGEFWDFKLQDFEKIIEKAKDGLWKLQREK